MKALILLAAFIANPAWASWKQMTSDEDADIYIDLESVETFSNSNYAWLLADLKDRGQGGEMSLRSHVEFDCSHRTTRQVQAIGHGEGMGQGEVVFRIPNPGEWRVIDGATGDAVLKVVCRP